MGTAPLCLHRSQYAWGFAGAAAVRVVGIRHKGLCWA